MHASLAPVIVVGGVKPNLVLIGVILVTVLLGFLPGITWAFVAGVAANLLVGDPLGAVPLALLLVSAAAAGGARIFGRVSWLYPVAAVLGGSVLFDLVSLAIGQLVSEAPLASGPPMDLLLGAAVLNAVIAGLLLVPARLLVMRYATGDAPAW